jgi:transglutaminase-like putative cysteine protease
MPRPVELARWVPDDNSGVRFIVQERMIPRILSSAKLVDIATFAAAFDRDTVQQSAESLMYWVRGHMIYTPDPPDEEFIRWPTVLMAEIRQLGTAVGDCDDYVMLYAALTVARQIPTRIVLIARHDVDDGAGQHQFDHIYTEVEIEDNVWVPVDPTGDVAFGWEHEPVYRKEKFDVVA